MPEMGERAVAGTEIVERDRGAEAPQAVQRLGRAGDVVDQRSLGDLEFERRGLDGETRAGLAQLGGERMVRKLGRRQIDRDPDLRLARGG